MMENKKKKAMVLRGFYYILGLMLIALGIILNTKTTLGVSPIISVAYGVSEIGGWNFGNMTFLLYSLFVLIEMIIHVKMHRKDGLAGWLLKDALQLPLSFVFTRFMNLFSFMIPEFETAFPDSFLGTIWSRLFFLAIAIILTGLGVVFSIIVRLIPNPGDGIVQAFSDLTGKGNGFIKNCLDITCVTTSIAIGLIVTGHLVGVGIGTILAAIGVGRVVAVANHFWREKILAQLAPVLEKE